MRVSERWQQGPENQWEGRTNSTNRRRAGVMQATHGGKAFSGAGVLQPAEYCDVGTWRIKSHDLGDEGQLDPRDTTLWRKSQVYVLPGSDYAPHPSCRCCIETNRLQREEERRSCKEFFTAEIAWAALVPKLLLIWPHWYWSWVTSQR